VEKAALHNDLQVLLIKRKTWTFWKNVRDGALNYIADMHAKRRQLLSHSKARLIQNTYRAHLGRLQSRSAEAVDGAAVSAAAASSASQYQHQQKRLPSKAAAILKRKSVVAMSKTASASVGPSPALSKVEETAPAMSNRRTSM
jgi:hypothetical protein